MASTTSNTISESWTTQGVRVLDTWDGFPKPKRPRLTSGALELPTTTWESNATGPLCAMKRLANATDFKQRPMTAAVHGSKAAVAAYVEQVARGEEAREWVLSMILREGVYMMSSSQCCILCVRACMP